MKLTDFLPVSLNQSVSANVKASNSATGGVEAFDRFLYKKVSEGDRTSKPAAKSRSQAKNVKTEDGDDVRSADSGKPETRPASETGQTEKTEDSGKPTKTEELATGDKTARTALNETDQAALAAEIAAALGISADEVMRLLASLGMTAADLAAPENVTAFMQALHGVSAPVELLWEPGVAEIANSINKAVTTFVENTADANETAADVNSILTEAQSALETQAAPVVQPQTTSQSEAYVQTDVVEKLTTEITAETIVGEDDSASTLEAVYSREEAEAPHSDPVKLATEEIAVDQPEQTPVQRTVTLSREPLTRLAAQNAAERDNTRTPVQATAQDFNTLTAAQFTDIAETVTSAKPADTMDVVRQIVDQLKVEVKADTTELRLTLKPESLGEVSMRIMTQNGVVTAQFYAESQRVKEIIESQFNQLKNSLQEKGIDVAEMTAFVGQEQNGANQAANRRGYEDDTRVYRTRTRMSPMTALYEDSGAEETEETATDDLGNPLEVNIKA